MRRTSPAAFSVIVIAISFALLFAFSKAPAAQARRPSSLRIHYTGYPVPGASQRFWLRRRLETTYRGPIVPGGLIIRPVFASSPGLTYGCLETIRTLIRKHPCNCHAVVESALPGSRPVDGEADRTAQRCGIHTGPPAADA